MLCGYALPITFVTLPKLGVPKTITCMHVVHSDGFRFGNGFEYTYLSKDAIIRLSPCLYIHACRGRIWMVDV